MRDRRLPQTDEELRDWIVQAWHDGWVSRRQMIGKPGGTVIAEKPQLLAAFLRSWDLPQVPTPPTTSLREAIEKWGVQE